MKKHIKDLSFTVVTHVYATGPAFFLEQYLIEQKVKKLFFIGIPFSYAKEKLPFFRYYENGELLEEKKLSYFPLPEVLSYIKDILLVSYLVMRKGTFDIYVGVDNLNAFTGIFLRALKKAKHIVFYTIDYVPRRFKNRTLNTIYHGIEKFAVYKSDAVWNLSERMREEREKRGYSIKFSKKQLIVPIGTVIKKQISSFKKERERKIVFMGHLRHGQGVELLLNAAKYVLAKQKSLRFVIIGGGDLEINLRKLTKDLGISRQVTFTGFIKDFRKVQQLLSGAVIAVAPYSDDEDSYTRFTDPGKVKDYLALGLPVIVTNVPQVSIEIEERKAGKAILFSKDSLAQAIIELLSDELKLKQYKKNAFAMAKDYTWENVFHKALQETISLC